MATLTPTEKAIADNQRIALTLTETPIEDIIEISKGDISVKVDIRSDGVIISMLVNHSASVINQYSDGSNKIRLLTDSILRTDATVIERMGY